MWCHLTAREQQGIMPIYDFPHLTGSERKYSTLCPRVLWTSDTKTPFATFCLVWSYCKKTQVIIPLCLRKHRAPAWLHKSTGHYVVLTVSLQAWSDCKKSQIMPPSYCDVTARQQKGHYHATLWLLHMVWFDCKTAQDIIMLLCDLPMQCDLTAQDICMLLCDFLMWNDLSARQHLVTFPLWCDHNGRKHRALCHFVAFPI